jgi:CRP/FNR family transcriptional regulator
MLISHGNRHTDCTTCEFRTLRLFCDLSPVALSEFAGLGAQMRLPRGAILFQEHDLASSVAVLCDGQVKLYCTSSEGKTMILKIAVPGDVLGLGAVVSGSPHEVTAEAIEPTLAKIIRKDQFLAFLEHHGQASMNAAQSLSHEYKAAFFDARRLALAPTAAGRLASVLLDWGRSASCGKPELRFTMALTHEELGNFAGTSRETVTRVLTKMRKDKLIQVRGTSVTILLPEKLSEMAC